MLFILGYVLGVASVGAVYLYFWYKANKAHTAPPPIVPPK